VNLEAVTRDDWILVGLSVLLIIDLLFLPWFSITVFNLTLTATATSDPDGWLAILAIFACIALIADLAIERLSPGTTLPNIGGSRTETRFVLACIAAVFVALKFLFHIHFNYFGYGFYFGVIITAALVYVAQRARSGHSMLGGFRRSRR
jgi:hypothetical protein